MLIYNDSITCVDSKTQKKTTKNRYKRTGSLKKSKKDAKKGYKRTCKPKTKCYLRKKVGGGRTKAKRISKKNAQFLERLGLKVKQKR